MAEFLWTSAKSLHGQKEFCTILNDVIRKDIPEEMEHAIIIIHAINRY